MFGLNPPKGLHPIGADLLLEDEKWVYCVLATNDFLSWRENVLPDIPTDLASDLSPDEEVDQFLYQFILGKTGGQVVRLRPTGHGVWEVKLDQTRLFGWFLRERCLVLAAGTDIRNVKDVGGKGYQPFFDAVIGYRKRLGLDYVAGDITRVLGISK
ncbi:MAG TPA: hypothetical protein VF574_04860 [Allosphingosinicella sp.]|jgi:hypothetical protein